MAALPLFDPGTDTRPSHHVFDLGVRHVGRWDEVHARLAAVLDEAATVAPDVDSMCRRAQWVLQQAVFEMEELHATLVGDAVENLHELQDELRRTSPFEVLEPSELRTLAGSVELRSLSAGIAIEKLNESGDVAHLIWEGAAFMSDGEREYMLGPGEWLDEIAVITGEARRISAVAMAPVKLICIPRGCIAELARRHPSVSSYFLDLFMRRHPQGAAAWVDLPQALSW